MDFEGLVLHLYLGCSIIATALEHDPARGKSGCQLLSEVIIQFGLVYVSW
jgi:hypothetical protein